MTHLPIELLAILGLLAVVAVMFVRGDRIEDEGDALVWIDFPPE